MAMTSLRPHDGRELLGVTGVPCRDAGLQWWGQVTDGFGSHSDALDWRAPSRRYKGALCKEAVRGGGGWRLYVGLTEGWDTAVVPQQVGEGSLAAQWALIISPYEANRGLRLRRSAPVLSPSHVCAPPSGALEALDQGCPTFGLP